MKQKKTLTRSIPRGLTPTPLIEVRWIDRRNGRIVTIERLVTGRPPAVGTSQRVTRSFLHREVAKLGKGILIKEIGRINAIFRYPVKSMAGDGLASAGLGWHGLEGDRRFAFRREADQAGVPWLTASRLPELLLYKPFGQAQVNKDLATHVRTQEGMELELDGEDLREQLARNHGRPARLMQLNQGIFDEAAVSLINLTTVRELERESNRQLDVLRLTKHRY